MKHLLCLALALCTSAAYAGDFYVSAARGKGKTASKEEPAKDLGIIADQLKAGDTVHIAAGTYYGRAESGAVAIEVPVKIIGGYSDDFSKRDPWGEFKTIFAGRNKSDNFDSKARLFIGNRKVKPDGSKFEILVDGVIFDNGERNGYVGGKEEKITRRADPSTKTNIAPDSAGLSIDAPEGTEVTITNCVVMNCAPHHKGGALKIFAGKRGKVVVRNNLVINNTGSGICGLSYFHGKEDGPVFTVENNTVLFTWRYDVMSTDCGSALKLESGIVMNASGNVFGFSDAYAVDNALKSKLGLTGNLFCASLIAPYLEFSTKLKLESIEDEAQCLSAAKDNVKTQIEIPVSETWAKLYASRTIIDRAAAESSVEPLDNWQNDVRRMLGLPLQGGNLDVKADVWLPRLSLDDALKAGAKKYNDKYGCEKPPAK